MSYGLLQTIWGLNYSKENNMGTIIGFIAGVIVGVVVYILISSGAAKKAIDDVKGKV